MNLYSQSLCNLICKQTPEIHPAPGTNLIVTIPKLTAHDAQDLLHRLSDFALQNGWSLIFKCADEYKNAALWDSATIEDFTAKDHFANGSLTHYRNTLDSTAATLTVLIGTALVTDSGSLDDFYSCSEAVLWTEGMEKSFKGWVEDFFDEYGLSVYSNDENNFFYDILSELHEISGLVAISNLLSMKFSSGSVDEIIAEFLARLDSLRLPNLSGYTRAKSKKRKFRYYTNASSSFISYEGFIDASKRKDASKLIEKFKVNLTKNGLSIPECKFYPYFNNQEEFIDALSKYIVKNDRNELESLLHCDFVYIIDDILKFKPKSESKSNGILIKLSGSPTESILQAIWQTFEKINNNPIEKILIRGIKYRHGIDSNNIENNKERAYQELIWLFGGFDRICIDHIQINFKYDNTKKIIPVESNLLSDNIVYESAKTAEPRFEFKVEFFFSSQEKETVVQRYAIKLPDIHLWMLASSLFSRAEQTITEGTTLNRPFSLPVFHLEYYTEFMMARDIDEQCRVLHHCLNANAGNFVENIISENWAKAPEAEPMQIYCSKLMASYRSFLHLANSEGLHTALNLGGETPDLFKQYNAAAEAFTQIDGAAKDCRQIASALMRSFLFIASRQGEDVDSWTVTPYERSGIVSVLHPAMLEMLQARIVFLFAAFSQVVSEEYQKCLKGEQKTFARSRWNYYRDLSEMKMPLVGLPINKDGRFEVCANGNDLLHRIGNIKPDQALASTRFLIRYDQTEEDDVAETEMFRESSESRHLFRILRDYNKMHPAADDGISIAIYRNNDVQPVLAAINKYVKYLYNNSSLELRSERYRVCVVFFSEYLDTSQVTNWLTQWQNYLEDKEEDETSEYANFRFNIAHRAVKIDDNYVQFAETIKNDVNVDIFLFYNFMNPGYEGSRFILTEEFDSTMDSIKFPVLEKAQCSSQAPDKKMRRSRVVSNRQFKVATNHAEIVARIRDVNAQQGQYHIVLTDGDYLPWRLVINKAHEAAEWVVCIDPCIDVALLGNADGEIKRELIGYGSGVGLHGESNYTISTQQFFMDDIKVILLDSIRRVYSTYGDKEHDEAIRDCLLAEAKGLGGLSIIRALGPDEYIRDFMAYCLMHRVLNVREDEWLCDKIFSIDAYTHWFEQSGTDGGTHPDLLWLRAFLTEEGRIHIDAKVIECKMAQANPEHLNKAKTQIQNGLKVLSTLFEPDPDGRRGIERLDQRYWYLQLHRLVAGCARVASNEEAGFLAAMERLTAGDFELTWNAAVFAFWTDDNDAKMRNIESFDVVIEGGTINAPIFTAGYRFVYGVSKAPKGDIRLDWGADVQAIPQPVVADEEVPTRELEPDDINISEAEPEEPQPPVQEEQPIQPPPSVAAPAIPTTPPQSEPTPASKPLETPAQQYKRILLGRTIPGNKEVYWEFGHPKLNNRHFLIFGNSGMGKTYAIQAMLCEFGKQEQNSLIVDYTNGFLPNQLQPITMNIISPYQFIVKNNKLPLCPFVKQKIDIGGVIIENSDIDVAKRVSAIFDSVYNIGVQQISILIDAIRDCVNLYGDQTTFDQVLKTIHGYTDDGVHQKASVTTLASMIKPFIQENAFASQETIGWDELFTNTQKRCSIFQMAGVDKRTSRILTEFVLWDLYSFVCSNGCEGKPKIVVLDEVQNLDQKIDSPLGKILTEGRKFGLCVIAATQTLSNLKQDEQARLFQAGQKLFFRPADPEINQYVKFVMQAAGSGSKDDWKQKLTSLQKGECLSIGSALDERTGMIKNSVQKIKITALDERNFNLF